MLIIYNKGLKQFYVEVIVIFDGCLICIARLLFATNQKAAGHVFEAFLFQFKITREKASVSVKMTFSCDNSIYVCGSCNNS